MDTTAQSTSSTAKSRMVVLISGRTTFRPMLAKKMGDSRA